MIEVFIPSNQNIEIFSIQDTMSTIHRFRNKYRLEVRERDHGPPHCHLVGGAIDVWIALETLDYRGVWPAGLRDEVIDWVQQHIQQVWKEWNKWHT